MVEVTVQGEDNLEGSHDVGRHEAPGKAPLPMQRGGPYVKEGTTTNHYGALHYFEAAGFATEFWLLSLLLHTR